MAPEQIKSAAQYLAGKQELNQSEREMWQAIATPKQVLDLINWIEYLEAKLKKKESTDVRNRY